MFNPTQVMIHACVEEFKVGYRQTYGSLKPDYAELLGWVGSMALEIIANSDALYHNVEHTVLVALTGQEVFRGRQAPPKPDAKRLLPGKLPRQIPSLLTM